MDFNLFFDKIDLAEEGRNAFFAIHERMSRPDFAEDYARAAVAFSEGDAEFGAAIAAFAAKEQLPVEVLNLYLYVRFSADTLTEYRRRCIDDEIFYATLFDLTIACRIGKQKYGVYGVPQVIYREWLRLNLTERLYRLGRLQFELIKSEYDLPEYGLKKGDTCLSTHIPRYEKLDDAACEAAYADARVFFREQYGIEHCVFFCHSWLLHPWMQEDLRPDSLIRKFAGKFKLLEVTESREAVINWVFFDYAGKDISEFPRDTSLRRAAIARMEQNRPLGVALGVRD